ncbi:helix-turn-helix domain-containing protein [Mesorhizobium japonicum]|uniref:helix-turn-helix domain-containing protein n=1 Tax=Mesorhizobium japonicum TaxID=2066070 RepID=UPI003B5CD9DA
MIQNERQYRVTQSARERLAREAEQASVSGAEPWIIAATLGSLQAQIQDLDEEIAEYDALRRHEASLSVRDLSELPRELVRARIASDLSQRELAARLGLKEQQIQRYEATGYAGASIGRLEEVMAALGVSFGGELELKGDAGGAAAVRGALVHAGFATSTIKRRFFASGTLNASTPWMDAASRAARVFKTNIDSVLAGDLVPAAGAVAYRARATANPDAISAYSVYAEYLAEIALRSFDRPYVPLPDADVIREQLGDRLQTDPFGALLDLCWEHGIPVIPISDGGTFYGACWDFDGRPVIVLKNSVKTPERWAFLLAHEMAHSRNPSDGSVLEGDRDMQSWKQHPDEVAADAFASRVLLGGDAEALTKVVIDRAGHLVGRLKAELPDVAEVGGVSVGLLADYVAHRLVALDVNWWPTANRLHSSDLDAWRIARSKLFENVDLSTLDALDRDIFIDGMAP